MEQIDNKKNFITAGYFLIRGANPQHWMNTNLLPPMLWSASRCICEKIPDSWIFPWNQKMKFNKEQERYKQELGLSDENFKKLQNLFNKLLAENEFGYPNVFMNRSLAQDLYAQYFYKIPDLKLISLAIPETEARDYVKHHSFIRGYAQNGLILKLRQLQRIKKDALPISYDVLGYDDADFHSLLCFSMEQELLNDYDIRFNQLGMIDSYEKTLPLIKKIHSDELTLEDGYWTTWLILEHSLTNNLQE